MKSKKHKLIEYANGKSLEEINGSIKVSKGQGFLKTLLMYSGPGALVAVGYMDPGNWATSITGGQDFQYLLMSVILMSSLIAMLLQYMSAKLGIVTQMDLAQAIRARTGKLLGIILWLLTELAIMATDIAEVIGAAIALNLLFNIPLIIAVFITVFDVLLLLLLSKIGFRKIEAIVVCLICVILFVFTYEVVLAHPNWMSAIKGLIPSPKVLSTSPTINGENPLTGALGIIGATVMPHNLYLHSSISQTRYIDHSSTEDVKRSVKFSTWDSNIQLTGAFFVNALLLIMGVAVFKNGAVKDTSFFGLFNALNRPSLLSNHFLAKVAKTGILSTLFAVALLASGQNSTITGTLTGQIIMEGFVHMKMPLWARRLVTRLLSVIPVLACVMMTSHDSLTRQHIAINSLMINSQVFLSLALPFSMVPLLMITNNKNEMGVFVNSPLIKILGWISVIALIYLNLTGLPDQMAAFFSDNPTQHEIMMGKYAAYIISVLIILLLIWVMVEMHFNSKHIKENEN